MMSSLSWTTDQMGVLGRLSGEERIGELGRWIWGVLTELRSQSKLATGSGLCLHPRFSSFHLSVLTETMVGDEICRSFPKLDSVVHFKLLSHWGLFTVSTFPLLGSPYVIPKGQGAHACSFVRMESRHRLWVWKGAPGAMTTGQRPLSLGVAATTGCF